MEQAAYDNIKKELTSNRVLKYYNVKAPVLLSVDASTKGLGAAIIQDGGVVAYASRALTSTEQKYAQIEKEMLAVVFGCTRFHKLLYGKDDVTIESDHQPLESLLKKTDECSTAANPEDAHEASAIQLQTNPCEWKENRFG